MEKTLLKTKSNQHDLLMGSLLGLSGLLFGMAALLFSLTPTGTALAQGPPGQKGPPPMQVRVSEVTEEKIAESITLVGTVEPRTRSIVASEIHGLVERFPIEEGDAVKRGQALAQLKTDTLELTLQAAEATLRETLVRHEQAERQLARTQSRHEEGLVTQKQLQDDLADEMALYEKASRLKTEKRRIQNDIGKSQVAAPFDGSVIQVFTQVGMWIQQGGPVAEIVDLHEVRIQVPVPERFISSLKIGDPATIRLDALPNFRAKGKILYIVSQADEASRTFPVRVGLNNPGQILKSGMMARLTLTVGTPVPVKVVPIDALVIQGDQYRVFVVNGSKAEPVRVQVLTMTEDFAEIQGPVEIGQRVVTRGNERLQPGQSIKILQ